jgi:hypothetical protein
LKLETVLFVSRDRGWENGVIKGAGKAAATETSRTVVAVSNMMIKAIRDYGVVSYVKE